MKPGFSFNKESCLVAMQHLSDIMPSDCEIYAWFAGKDNKVFRSQIINSHNSISEISSTDELIGINSFRRNQKTPTSWILKSNLPLPDFETVGLSRRQFDIFDERDHIVLCLRIKSLYDSGNDVICIILKPELNVFGIETGKLELTPEFKSIIANILHKSILSILNNSYDDRKKLTEFADKTRKLMDTGRAYKQSLKQSREDYHRNIADIAENYLSELSKTMDVEFIFSDDSLELLKNYSGNPVRLKDILEKAAVFAYNMQLNDSTLIAIEEEYLELTDTDIYEKTEGKAVVKSIDLSSLSKEQRVEKKLDEYQNALKNVLANKLKPTGKNVGEAMKESITPAGITDFLKNNDEIINKLVKTNSNRWSILLKEFRPLQNIIKIKAVPDSKNG
jgi:hypothetical protein